MNYKIGNDWDEVLEDIFASSAAQRLFKFLDQEYDDPIKHICPAKEHLFDAFKLCSYADTKVVILGRDPYVRKGEAHGLAFSILPGGKVPAALIYILVEIHDELGCYFPRNNGCLIPWAKQGVLLMNSIMTTEERKSGAHADIGWEDITDKILHRVSEKSDPVCFMLWGWNARQKDEYITNQQLHLVLKGKHPSPLSGYGFFGCNHFKQCNEMLREAYGESGPIDWQLPHGDILSSFNASTVDRLKEKYGIED